MTVLTVSSLTKKYGDTVAVKDVSFSLENNKTVALIGPNGAGKTTILRMLAGLMNQTDGDIQFQTMQKNGDVRSVIGYLPQYPVFYNWMTGKEFLVYSAQLTHIEKNEAIKRAEKLLKRVGISDAKNKRISTYSGGMKQRLGIAQAIIHHPKLLILDEPVSALDPIGRRDVLTLMEQLKEEMTILFSTHILSDADEVSDELILLHHGRLIEAGSMDTLRDKYKTSMIELTFENAIEQYKEKLEALPSVLDVNVNRNVLHVSVANIADARTDILTATTTNNWPLMSFAINRASLEEMFMKAVSE